MTTTYTIKLRSDLDLLPMLRMLHAMFEEACEVTRVNDTEIRATFQEIDSIYYAEEALRDILEFTPRCVSYVYSR